MQTRALLDLLTPREQQLLKENLAAQQDVVAKLADRKAFSVAYPTATGSRPFWNISGTQPGANSFNRQQ